MQFQLKRTEQELSVTCEGRFTFADHHAFREVVEEVSSNPPAVLIFNVNNVDFVDSAGLGMLLIANNACNENDTDVVIRGATGQVEKMVRIAKFGDLMTID